MPKRQSGGSGGRVDLLLGATKCLRRRLAGLAGELALLEAHLAGRGALRIAGRLRAGDDLFLRLAGAICSSDNLRDALRRLLREDR